MRHGWQRIEIIFMQPVESKQKAKDETARIGLTTIRRNRASSISGPLRGSRGANTTNYYYDVPERHKPESSFANLLRLGYGGRGATRTGHQGAAASRPPKKRRRFGNRRSLRGRISG